MFKSIFIEIFNKNKILISSIKQTTNYVNNCYLSTNSLFKNLNKSSIILSSNNNCFEKITKKYFSISSTKNGLMEFFDNEKNWGQPKVDHGREWRLDELRLKSNVDLHKLWFILLKERNMLLTMQEEYKREHEVFPNPERIAKVDISMENILHVVKERDIAYNLLETGESKQIIPHHRFNSFGFLQYYKPREYYLPWFLNSKWKLRYSYKKLPFWSKWFRTMLAAKQESRRKRLLKMIENRKDILRKKYPDLVDEQYLKDYLETKFNVKPRVRYTKLIERPRPDDVPEEFKEKPKNKVDIYEEQF